MKPHVIGASKHLDLFRRAYVDRARREDVDLDSGEVLVRGSKRTTRWRTNPIVFDLQRVYLRFALDNSKGRDELLFTSWQNCCRDLSAACKRAGIDRVSPNDLRRTFSHWMSQSGVPNELLAPMMGHADTRMLDRVYNFKTPEELRVAVRRAMASTVTYTSQTLRKRSGRRD